MTTDLIDTLVPLPATHPLYAVRHRRDKVVAGTQGSHAALFDAALAAPPLAERLLVAQAVAQASGVAVLQAHYAALLRALPGAGAAAAVLDREAPADARTAAVLRFAQVLATAPADGDRALLLTLPAAGLATDEVVVLAQLVAYVAYQARVVAGLQALAAVDAAATPAPGAAEPAAPFVHPAHLPKPGEPLRVNGYTSETLDWRAWLPVVALESATPAQLAVLESSHPKARTSDYYRLLVHAPRILEERSTVFNAIMYAPGGLSRAERELASTVVSRVNGCVYCASVHAQRFEQLARRNDVIHDVFVEPQGAGTNARERAIVQLAIDLTAAPGRFGPAQLQPALAAGLSWPELLDALHAIAIFAWANRLMLNLGEAVWPQAER